MDNFITQKQLEQETEHKHYWTFYDNYSKTFEHVLKQQERDPIAPIGTVYECECGAREIRFIVWTGKYDQRKKGLIKNE